MPRKSKYEASTTKTPTAQKKAMDDYRKRKGGAAAIQRGFSTTYSRQEGDRIAAAMKAASITPAQILRAVASWIEDDIHAAAVAAIPTTAAEYERQNAAIRQAERETHAAQSATTAAEQPAAPADPAPGHSK